MSGKASHLAGLAAEDQVARHYAAQGHDVSARRWRGAGGELDLVLADGDGFIFVEVKKSATHARAAHRILPRQVQRLFDAASEFLGSRPRGLNTPARFDVALVDRFGRVEILANALSA